MRSLLGLPHLELISLASPIIVRAIQMNSDSLAQDPLMRELSKRIKELNDKASQLLLFLSFAIAGAVLLEANTKVLTTCQLNSLKWSLRFWVISLFPILVSVLPVKELAFDNVSWYQKVQRSKVLLLWGAVLLMVCGAIGFLIAIW